MTRARLQVLVTRPRPQALDWVQRLRSQHVLAQALPLIAIQAATDIAPLLSTWQNLQQFAMLVFVSPNAVEQFFAVRPKTCSWPMHLVAATVGPGSAQVLQRYGVPATQIVQPAPDSSSFDSESLWVQLASRSWAAHEVLVVRGASAANAGRDWLAQRLLEQGARVSFVQAYSRGAPNWDEAEEAIFQQALAKPQSQLWFFSSSEAIGYLKDICDQRGGGTDAFVQAIATHERIATSARALGFRSVLLSRPDEAQVVQLIRYCQASPK